MGLLTFSTYFYTQESNPVHLKNIELLSSKQMNSINKSFVIEQKISPLNLTQNKILKTIEKSNETLLNTPEIAEKNIIDEMIQDNITCNSPSLVNANLHTSLVFLAEKVVFNSNSEPFEDGFAMTPWDDQEEEYQSSKSGFIYYEKNHSKVTSRFLKFSAQGYLSSNIQVSHDGAENHLIVPMIDEKKLEKFLKSEKIVKEGGYLLVKVMDQFIDVALDKKFGAKIYFDENLKPIEPEKNSYQYIMLTGLSSGINLMTLKDSLGVKYSKEIFITENEVLVENPSIVNETKNFVLCADYPGSRGKLFEDIIDVKKLVVPSYYGSVIYNGSNNYSYDSLDKISGAQDTLIIDEKKSPQIEFKVANGKIVNPSREKINLTLNSFIGDDENGCTVQINIFKPVKEIVTFALNEEGVQENASMLALQDDGVYSQDILPVTKEIYLNMISQGIIAAKISFEDGSEDFVTHYCSLDTYIIEN